MNTDTLQTVSQITTAIGIALTFFGGIGAYYFSKKAQDELRQEFQTNFYEIEEKLKPFQELAHTARPDLGQDAALDSLREEITRLREVAAKHQFTPLAPALRIAFVEKVREVAPTFSDVEVSVRITLETWSRSTTREYAAQLASLLREGGLRVEGPDQITYFLVTPASPIEFGYNPANIALAATLFDTLRTIIRSSSTWTKKDHQGPNSLRIHFGGEVIFESTGIVEIR